MASLITRKTKTKLRYVFTLEDVRLSCGPALLQAAVDGVSPTVTLTWRSSKKAAFAGPVRADGSQGARWEKPVSLACSVYTSTRNGKTKFEPRPSELVVKIEGAAAARRKLTGSFDLAMHVSYQRTSDRLSVPLSQGAGTLQFTLSSVWLKRSALDESGSEDSASQSEASSVSTSSTYTCGARFNGGADGGSGLVAGCVSAKGETPLRQLALEAAPADAAAAALALAAAGHRRVPSDGAAPFAQRSGSFSAKPIPASDGIAAAAVNITRSRSFGAKLKARVAGAGPPKPGSPSEGSSSDAGCSMAGVGTSGVDGGGRHGAADSAAQAEGMQRPLEALEEEGAKPNAKPPTDVSDDGVPPFAILDDPGSLFEVSLGAMKEVLSVELPMGVDELQENFLGIDCDSTRFGRLLCAKLGYQQLESGMWEGNEAEGLTREVRLVVKCPPKPLLPDVTRVHLRHRLRRLSQETLLLERELCTLDVPYGDSFRVQERWVATRASSADEAQLDMDEEGVHEESCLVHVCTHVQFKGRVGLMSKKISHHALKKSRKMASLAVELLTQARTDEMATPQPDAAADEGSSQALAELKEQYAALLEEASYLKRRVHDLERENKRLHATGKYARKSKRQLVNTLGALEAQLAKERYERAAMEEALTEAYTATIKTLLEDCAGSGAGEPTAAAGGSAGHASRSLLKPSRKR